MDRQPIVLRELCHRCQRPAHTVGRDGVPYCNRHALTWLPFGPPVAAVAKARRPRTAGGPIDTHQAR